MKQHPHRCHLRGGRTRLEAKRVEHPSLLRVPVDRWLHGVWHRVAMVVEPENEGVWAGGADRRRLVRPYRALMINGNRVRAPVNGALGQVPVSAGAADAAS